MRSSGVDPQPLGWYDSSDAIIWHAVEVAVRAGLARPGDEVVVLAGDPDETLPTSDVLPGRRMELTCVPSLR